MALNKLDNQIKEKLNSREIQPSAQAWDRLDAMLSVTEEKKEPNKSLFSFKIIAIAAAILLALTIGWKFMNQNVVDIPSNSIVIDKKQQSKPSNNTIESNVEQLQNNESVVVEDKVITSESKSSNVSKQLKKEKSNHLSNEIVEVKSTQIKETINAETNKISNQTTTSVAQNNQKAPENNQVIEIKPNDENIAVNLNSTKIKVDATSLLNEVDGELEQSFREKMFQKINKNFKEIKQAVATRNYQE